MQITSTLKKTLTAAAAVATLATIPVVTAQPAAAFGHRGFGGPVFRHGGFGYGGGYGGYRGGYYRGGRGYGLGYGLAGFGLGLGVGSLYGGYGGYGYPYGGYGYGNGYYGAGYGGYGGCLRRVYGYYGPHLVRVC